MEGWFDGHKCQALLQGQFAALRYCKDVVVVVFVVGYIRGPQVDSV